VNVIWRLLVAALLLGGAVIWVPAMSTAASAPTDVANPAVRGPLAQDNDDNSEDDNAEDDNFDGDNDNDSSSDNNDGVDNDNASDNDNDWASDNDNDNFSDNDNDADPAPTSTPVPGSTVPNDPNNAGAQVTNGDLTVDLWRSTDRPVVNTPFQLGVTGSGAPIERVWIWADAPGGNAGPANDDFAWTGERSRDCGGINPCDQSWTLIARNVGYYNIHAKVRDTSGREVQTDWYVLFSENPR
jgi:hypothetical protein